MLQKNCEHAEINYKNAKLEGARVNKDIQDILERYEIAKKTLNNLPHPHISSTLFLIIFLIITIAEIAFNGLVFRVFGQSQLHTLIMAIGIMVALPWLSDFIGRKLRMENKSNTTIMLMIIATVVVFSGLLVIAILREKFFEANKIIEALGIQWDANSIVITFLIVNIVLFASIVILSYEAGHKNPSAFKSAKKELDEAERVLKEKTGDIDESAKKLINAKLAFSTAHSERIHKFEDIQYKAEEEKDGWAGYVRVYRASNMDARADKTLPKSFKRDPEELIKIPDVLKQLDCSKCCYAEVKTEDEK
ncbi:MAG: hypothetical protein AB1480_15530 [Nitrospirota bacterium]